MSMRVIAIQSSPNHDGLTAGCAQQALDGAVQAGAEVELVHLCDLRIKRCQQCERGWGKCRTEGSCVLTDDFQALREKLWAADCLILSTPVYYGDLSESAKSFLDRLRRCEATQGDNNRLRGKVMLGIAAAGGGGGGTVTCAQTMERTMSHVGVEVFDILPVRRRTRGYILPMLVAAGKTLVEWTRERG